MANKNGLCAPEAYAAPNNPYYASSQLRSPTLVSPITLQAAAAEGTLAVPAEIYVDGTNAISAAYVGAVNITPGGNAASATPGAGITVRTAAGPSTIVEVGANAQGPNLLYIAGASGVGQVYDEVYNQPVSLQPLTMVSTNANLTPANPEECLRSAQAGVAAAAAAPGTIFNVFRVPRSGAYTIQTEIAMGNAGPTNTVVIPSTVVGGVPIWKSISLSFQVQGTVIPVPYASFEVLGGDFYGEQAFAASSLVSKTFSSVAILTAGVNYAVVLNAPAGWNIGDAGQIKTELIAMC